MKKLLTTLCLVLLVSCSDRPPPEVPSYQLVEREWYTYQVNSDQPFTGTGVSYYYNGQLKSKDTYVDGRITLVERYYENGQLEMKGTSYFDIYVNLLTISDYYEGYYENGQLHKKWDFRGVERSGDVEEYNSKGKLVKKITFENDIKVKTDIFFENGRLKQRDLRVYEDDFNVIGGVVENYNEYGQLISEDNHWKKVSREQTVESQGITYEWGSTTPFTGIVVDYYENFQLQHNLPFKNGKPDGLLEQFYENGQFKKRGNLKNGKQYGLWEYFDEEGNLTKTEEYKDGVLQD